MSEGSIEQPNIQQELNNAENPQPQPSEVTLEHQSAKPLTNQSEEMNEEMVIEVKRHLQEMMQQQSGASQEISAPLQNENLQPQIETILDKRGGPFGKILNILKHLIGRN